MRVCQLLGLASHASSFEFPRGNHHLVTTPGDRRVTDQQKELVNRLSSHHF